MNAAATAAPAVNGTAVPADAAAPAAAPVVAAEPTKKRPGRKPGSKNKPKAEASATPAVAGAAPKKRRYVKKSKSVCMAPPSPNGACKKRVTAYGLCANHSTAAKRMVEKGLTTWADLIKAGVARGKYTTPTRQAFLDAVQASKAAPSAPVAAPVAAPVVSHVVPITPIVTN